MKEMVIDIETLRYKGKIAIGDASIEITEEQFVIENDKTKIIVTKDKITSIPKED